MKELDDNIGRQKPDSFLRAVKQALKLVTVLFLATEEFRREWGWLFGKKRKKCNKGHASNIRKTWNENIFKHFRVKTFFYFQKSQNTFIARIADPHTKLAVNIASSVYKA